MTLRGENQWDQWVKCSQTADLQRPTSMVLERANLMCPITCIQGDRCNFTFMILIFILVTVKVKYLVSSSEVMVRVTVAVARRPGVIRGSSWGTRMTALSKIQGPMRTLLMMEPQGHSLNPQGRWFLHLQLDLQIRLQKILSKGHRLIFWSFFLVNFFLPVNPPTISFCTCADIFILILNLKQKKYIHMYYKRSVKIAAPDETLISTEAICFTLFPYHLLIDDSSVNTKHLHYQIVM